MGLGQKPKHKNAPRGLLSDSTKKASIEIRVRNDTVWIRCPDPKSGQIQHVGATLRDDLRLRERLVREGILASMNPEGLRAATWFCIEACHWPASWIWLPDGRLLFKPRAALEQLLAFQAKLESICKEDPRRKRTLIYVLSDLDKGMKLANKSIESLAQLSSQRKGSSQMKRSQKRGQWFRKPESVSYALDQLFESQATKHIPHSERCERIARFQREYLDRDLRHPRQAIENQINTFKAKPHLKHPMEILINLLLTYRWQDLEAVRLAED